MHNLREILTLTVVMAGALIIGGCENGPENPYLTDAEAGFLPGNHLAGVMEAPVNTMMRDDLVSTGIMPWWADRNDYSLNYQPGANTQMPEYGIVYTVDRLHTHGDHVRDQYRQTRRSVRVIP